MPLIHRAEHGKVTPGHIRMVIEADGLLPGRQRAGGSASLCLHQRGWHGELLALCERAMRVNHRAEHGKVTPGHISMVIDAIPSANCRIQ